MSYMNLLVELLGLLSDMGGRVGWLRLLGHMGLEGNEIASSLALACMCHTRPGDNTAAVAGFAGTLVL